MKLIKNNETSPSILWVILKAYIRGKIIYFTSYSNKLRRSQQKDLEMAIKEIELSISLTNTPDLKTKTASNQIIQITDDSGLITSDPDKMNDTFRSFFTQLYTSESFIDESQLYSLFEKLDLPKLKLI